MSKFILKWSLALVACFHITSQATDSVPNEDLGRAMAVARANHYKAGLQADIEKLKLEVQINQVELQGLKERAKFDASNEQLRQDIFRSQLAFQPYIFCLVALLVAAGIYFSYLQLRHQIRPVRQRRGGIEADSNNPALQNLKPSEPSDVAGPHGQNSVLDVFGVKFASPIIGLIVLALTFLFFQSYLQNVYRIEDIGSRYAKQPSDQTDQGAQPEKSASAAK